MALKFFAKLPAKVQIGLAKALAATAPAYFAERVHKPVFVVGCGRSGTTLLNRTLGVHPEIANYPAEANELWHPQLYPWHKSTVDVPPFWSDPHRFTEQSLALRTPADDRWLKAVFGAFQVLSGGRCFLNKTVMVTFMLPHVQKLFPEARFIHLYRDGRAVALSYAVKEKPKMEAQSRYASAGHELPFDALLDMMAAYWQYNILVLEQEQERLQFADDGGFFEMSYEALCESPSEGLVQMATFVGISPEPFLKGDYSYVRNTNYKFQERLQPERIETLTHYIKPALSAKGYTK